MKIIKLLLVSIVLAASPALYVGCGTPPNQRVATVTSLKVAGQIAEQAVASSAILFRDGIIDSDQARAVTDFYDLKFQPAFRSAVIAARVDYSTPASPEIVALASELSNMVLNLSKK